MNTDWTWVDMRWCEPGWQVVFRLRLAGWLPQGWVAAGLKSDVLTQEIVGGRAHLSLTRRGRYLTDVDKEKFSDDGARVMAEVLAHLSFKRSWFLERPPIDTQGQTFGERFEGPYASKILGYFLALPSREQRTLQEASMPVMQAESLTAVNVDSTISGKVALD
ncbi:hypothetical protein [Salipiger sp. PrR002]|uniref:hypothetical protein n=1 Tax=Salipiger sp. PrR002 TaxID=2706489 RepID=UPI0013BC2035|nr:hypothetical protein [Salipiger sp. PrR002]NDW00237.1 hypothetical protein [Salipiger sp. PrR002]NDW58624.1 hypothetical protein [Salipiger sp. PrR004]